MKNVCFRKSVKVYGALDSLILLL